MPPTDLHDCFLYEESDIPPGLSIAEWRHERARARAPRRHSLLQLLLPARS